MSEILGRPVRADARRNRELLLDAAVRAFANDGADVTLDAIAKSAGVGSERSTVTSRHAMRSSRRPIVRNSPTSAKRYPAFCDHCRRMRRRAPGWIASSTT